MTVCRCGNTIHRSNRGAFCDLCSEGARIPERQYAYVDVSLEGRDGLILDDIEVSAYRDPETGRIAVQIRARDSAEDLDEDGGPICDIVKIPREPVPEPNTYFSGGTVATGVVWTAEPTMVVQASDDPAYTVGSTIRVRPSIEAARQIIGRWEAISQPWTIPGTVIPEDDGP